MDRHVIGRVSIGKTLSGGPALRLSLIYGKPSGAGIAGPRKAEKASIGVPWASVKGPVRLKGRESKWAVLVNGGTNQHGEFQRRLPRPRGLDCGRL